MPFEIPIQEPIITNPALLPKVQFNLSVQEVGSQIVSTLERLYGRSIMVEILITNVTAASIQNAITRVFSEVQNAVINNLNPIQETVSPLQRLTDPFDNPEVTFYVSVDKAGASPLVNVYVYVRKLRQEFLTEYLSDLKTYIFAAITTDLNP